MCVFVCVCGVVWVWCGVGGEGGGVKLIEDLVKQKNSFKNTAKRLIWLQSFKRDIELRQHFEEDLRHLHPFYEGALKT